VSARIDARRSLAVLNPHVNPVSPVLSVVFAGTPEFSVPTLEALARSPHRLVAVYTQPDRPAGRGREIATSAVKRNAQRLGVPIEQPKTLREADAVARLRAYAPDVMVVVAYGLLLPDSALGVPRLGCINIHASLLPRWRGAAPIQRAVQAGDRMTGVTIMKMDAGLDTGPMLATHASPVGERDTSGTVHDRLARLGADALLGALEGLVSGSLVGVAQPAEGVTYAAKIKKEEAVIDWSKSAAELDRLVRAFNPWPIAETVWNGQQLRVWEAVPLDTTSAQRSGTVTGVGSEGIDVATGAGVLRLVRVQLAGRRPVTAAEFINAHRIDGALLPS
jgi:methionyl-tRNA formyltransferase